MNTQELIDPVINWHKSLEDSDYNLLYELLDEEFTFFSPVVHRPKDKHMGFIYLIAASKAFLNAEDFRYVREIKSNHNAMLEFNCEIDGIQVNGIDTFKWNDEMKFTEMKVYLRPQKSLQVIQQEMEKHLTNPQINSLLSLSKFFKYKDYNDHIKKDSFQNTIFGLLFFEPSTRTSMSFESAIHRLGGKIIKYKSICLLWIKRY